LGSVQFFQTSDTWAFMIALIVIFVNTMISFFVTDIYTNLSFIFELKILI
jgi:hypothetical protein